MIHSRDISYNLHKLVFLLDKISEQVLQAHLHMTFSQFRILMAIDCKEYITQKDIAGYWDMTDAAVSRQVEMLMDKKLIFREENTENRRQHILSLTALGKKSLGKAYNVLESKYEEIFSIIDQRERKIIAEGIQKLLEVICPGEEKTCTRRV